MSRPPSCFGHLVGQINSELGRQCLDRDLAARRSHDDTFALVDLQRVVLTTRVSNSVNARGKITSHRGRSLKGLADDELLEVLLLGRLVSKCQHGTRVD